MKPIRSRSIFLRLFTGILGAMLVVWAGVLSWQIYRVDDYKRAYAREIKAWSQEIAIAMETASGSPENMRSAARDMEKIREDWFRGMNELPGRWLLQIWKGQTLVYASSDPRLPAARPLSGAPGSSPALPNNATWMHWIESSPAYGVTVRIDEEAPTFGWQFTPQHMWYHLSPLLYSLPFLLLPAWLIIRIGLRPLRDIDRDIAQRSAADLSPLPPSPYRELSPLVASINRLMERLIERLQREKEFLVDAAHELKTPLAIIQVNAGSLTESRDPVRLQQARQGLSQGVARAVHTVHQLLALARSDADRGHIEIQPLDLAELVRDRLASIAHVAMQRGIDIELQAPEACCLPLHRESMVAMLDNLIGNALKYSPDRGHVLVSIAAGSDQVCLSVADQGPGIPPALRRQVFERFYRVPGQEQEGSGLGLAIVEKAAALNHAAIELAAPAHGSGLIVNVRFAQGRTQKQPIFLYRAEPAHQLSHPADQERQDG